MSTRRVFIVSTAHWEGDPRLNRHLEYLRAVGWDAKIETFHGRFRPWALVLAVVTIARTEAEVVILPDPDLFLAGSLAARISGKRPVMDIHEDYPKAAMARPWVPSPFRPLVRVLARAAVRLGRLAAWRVLVAASELAEPGDLIALNIPDPTTMGRGMPSGNRLVYVGDLTVARGALAMVEVMSHLDTSFRLLLIGRIDGSIRTQLEDLAQRLGVIDRIETTGQLGHKEAWQLARDSLAGLNLLTPAPAYVDAVATKLWEYMAVGLPVIVSELPGQARVVSLIDPDLVCPTPARVAEIADRLSRDSSWRETLIDRGRRLVEEAWSQSRPDLTIQSIVEP